MIPSNHLILCCPLIFLPSIFPSTRVFPMSQLFTSGGQCWSFSINPSNEYSGLISFRMDWFYLLAVQGTLKSLLQHHNPKASILWHSAFFTVQLSHLYMMTGKTTALTIWIFVGKVMSVFFNMLSRFVITFLSRSKHLLISWLQWFWSPKRKQSVTVSIFPPNICLQGGFACHCTSRIFSTGSLTLPMPGRGPRADPAPGFQQGLVLNFYSEDNHPGSQGEIGFLVSESRNLSQQVLGGTWESTF